MESFYARKLKISGDTKYQTLENHILGVKNRISKYSKMTSFKDIAELTALIHDAGKFSYLWQEYLMGEKIYQGKVQHSLSGMSLINDLFESTKLTTKLKRSKSALFLTKDFVQYVVGSHHGLFDALDSNTGEQNIDRKVKLAKEDSNYVSVVEEFYKIFNQNELTGKLIKSIESIDKIISKSVDVSKRPNQSLERLYYGVIVKFLLSMLIDGDWSDARSFEDNFEYEYDEKLEQFNWKLFIDNLERKLRSFEIRNDIDLIRKAISNECKEAANRKPGIYRLSVPTGGGKTLASMRFALHHANKNNMSRILYIAPYNSILEQNAKVYRDVLCSNYSELEDFILEHHHNVIFENEDQGSDENAALVFKGPHNIYKYLSENWSAPIVLTSFVQLLNSFFSSKKTSIRRLHRLSNSVVIIDELQSLPVESTAIFNATINAISKFFNTTFVLCTASHPPFNIKLGEGNHKKIPSIEFSEQSDLVEDYSDYEAFRRVVVKDETKSSGYNLSDITTLIENSMLSEESLLVIMNTKKAVNKVYKELLSKNHDYKVVCLSTYQVPNHRKKLIENIKNKLGHEKIVVISTPLIEAGVDISFTGVIRSITGLDSIFQAAGRCNRNGEKEKGKLIIINLSKEIENTSRMEEVQIKKEIMYAKLADFRGNPNKYGNSLLSQKALERYFIDFYNKISDKSHYNFGNNTDKTVYDLINMNTYGIDEYKARNNDRNPRHFINQAFKEAGDRYQVIEDSGITVIIPWGRGEQIINRLYSEALSFKEIKDLINESQGYSVNLFPIEITRLQLQGALIQVEDKNLFVLKEGYYNPNMGISFERQSLETKTF